MYNNKIYTKDMIVLLSYEEKRNTPQQILYVIKKHLIIKLTNK